MISSTSFFNPGKGITSHNHKVTMCERHLPTLNKQRRNTKHCYIFAATSVSEQATELDLTLPSDQLRGGVGPAEGTDLRVYKNSGPAEGTDLRIKGPRSGLGGQGVVRAPRYLR